MYGSWRFHPVTSINIITYVTILFTLQAMYMSYVKNSKFTSPSTIPLINFMQMSMVEIFGIDLTQAYQHAFVYIRQLAIHLRNAITVKKKVGVKNPCSNVIDISFYSIIVNYAKIQNVTWEFVDRTKLNKYM